MQNKSKESILQAYKKVYQRIKSAGLKIHLQILENKCSEVLKQFIREQNVDRQQECET